MRLNATLPSRLLWALALSMALALLPGGSARADVDPLWDHYKVYEATPEYTLGLPVTLFDQFMASTHQVLYLDLFANPVEKRHDTLIYPIHHPELHYSWWKIDPQPFSKDVIAINQFGEHIIHVGEAQYLLNPALKNAQPGFPLPVANHYKCYACSGDPVNADVFLIDQFVGRPAHVFFPRFFCNPADKRAPNGVIYPMVDPKQHYVVYDIDPFTPIYPATIRDQFLIDQHVDLNLDHLLMVPTEKVEPTPSDPTTWGKLKHMYR